MFDRATCSTMTLGVIPMVNIEALIQLRRHLDYVLGKKGHGVEEGEETTVDMARASGRGGRLTSIKSTRTVFLVGTQETPQ
jgi:hypothetical protein